jgi:hypothetical protein
MLSMVASIFELREGIEMPSTVVELYKVAVERCFRVAAWRRQLCAG